MIRVREVNRNRASQAGRHPLKRRPSNGTQPKPCRDHCRRRLPARLSLELTAIAVFTVSGSTARLISRFRPPGPIYSFTPFEEAAQKLSLTYGVTAIIVPNTASTDEMLLQMDQELQRQRHFKPHDQVVFVSGQPISVPGSTNRLKLHRAVE